MKITKFDKSNLSVVRTKIQQALSKVEDELGIKLDLGSISFDQNSFSARMKCGIVGDGGKKEVNLLHQAYLSGMGAPLGSKLTLKGKHFEVTGYNASKPKNCIEITEISTGKIFGCNAESAQYGIRSWKG